MTRNSNRLKRRSFLKWSAAGSVGRLRIIFEESPVAHCLFDSSGPFIDVNKAAARILGYSRRELRGKEFSELNVLTPDQSAKLESSLKSGKPGRPTGLDEYILSRKDRSQVFIESQSLPIKIGDQDLALTMVIDMTYRKLAEQALHFHSKLLFDRLRPSKQRPNIFMGITQIKLFILRYLLFRLYTTSRGGAAALSYNQFWNESFLYDT